MNCIVAENSLDAIFMNLRQFYTPNTKKGQKIEVKGYHFEVDKYLVKFGSIVLGSSNKGIVVEVRAGRRKSGGHYIGDVKLACQK